MKGSRGITYKKAGVDITKADKLIKDMAGVINGTRVKGSMGAVGGFGGLFDLSKAGKGKDILVASTDGVGTKLKVAQIAEKHDTVGQDLVAMCVNDILCCGARPLFFLDYFACGELNKKIWNAVLKGIVDGCHKAGCALLGGETAEMPGMYAKGEYDLAGFSVGSLARKDIIDGKKIKPGDAILGIASSGLHSNGFSLVRKLFSSSEIKKRRRTFLAPTVIYAGPFSALVRSVGIKGAAHITGGGITDNVPRMLPRGVKAVINKGSWKIPVIFDEISERAGLGEKEMYRTFNMGIGMALVIPSSGATKARKILLKKFGMKSWVIGVVEKGDKKVEMRKGEVG